MEDLIIGKDVAFQEYEGFNDLLQALPVKAQVGPKTLVGQVRGIKEHGVKGLLTSLKENFANENIDIEYTCLDISHQVVVLGSNIGMVFFYDRDNKQFTRFSSNSVHVAVSCVKLLPLQSFLASGHSNGHILLYSYTLSPRSLPKSEHYPVSGVHASPVTCLEWSPDGNLLYSGDQEGKISVTVVKVPGIQSVLLFTANSPIVQLSYSHKALLVSTCKRTVLWNFSDAQPLQVGQKERKSPGQYGACFYPPAKLLLDDESEAPLTIYAARPGLRLWTADQSCKVLATLMYKGLLNENPPGVRTLTPLPSPSLADATKIDQTALAAPKFGRLQIFHGQFVVTWDLHRLWVLDTSPCALVCYYHDYHGNIIDVCTVGHEIYILQHNGSRLLKRFSLIPKLTNPLLEVQLLLKTEKLEPDVSEALEPKKDTSAPQKDSEGCSESNATNSASVAAEEEMQHLAVLAPMIQHVVHEDYGDIVFKPKRTPKRKNKTTESQYNDQDIDSANEEASDISSELDYLDRSVSNNNSTDEDLASYPRITRVDNETYERTSVPKQDKMVLDNLVAPSGKHSVELTNECELHPSQAEFHNLVLPDDRKLSQSDESTLASDKLSYQSDESILTRVNTDSQSEDSLSTRDHKSSLSEDSVLDDHEDAPSNPYFEGFHSLPQIYSSTPLNLSDLSFSEVSHDMSGTENKYDKQFPRALPDSSIDVISDSPSFFHGSREADSSQETLPVCLDVDGAEELGDTVLWKSQSSHTLSELDSMEFFRSIERTYTSQMSEASKSSSNSEKQMHLLVDSWSDVRPPSPGYVVSLDVSDIHIWCVTSYDNIFYCPTRHEAVSWTQLEGQAKMISVNNSGDVIWYVDGKNNAFARTGIREGNLIGAKWLIVEKNIRYVAVDDTAVWGIMNNGDVFMRIEVSKEKPEGKTGKTIAVSTDFVQASCLDGLVWFVDKRSRIHVYKEANPRTPSSEENWHILTDLPARCMCLKIYGWSWLVDTKGALWFTDKVTHQNPIGSEWYQVSLGQYLMQDKTLLDTLWSWVRRGDETKLLTASPKAGLWILGKNGSLNSSRGHLLGGHWQSITPMGVAMSVFWSYISARGYYAMEGKGNLWALQPSGELICFQPGSRTLAVESPRTVVKLVAASSKTVWGITHNFKVVQRLGVMEDLCPQGVEWKSVELSSFSVGRVCHISSGTLCTWAVDESGGIWLRIGDVEKTDNLVSQVWIAIEGEPIQGNRFVKVAVSPDDAIVWALDDRFNVYARRDVTSNFQVGTSWEVVPGTIVKDLCISESHVVWAVCANGDIACRFGVSEVYPLGNYWKKVPGNFEHLSVTPDGELWAINLNGQLFRRKTKHFYGTQSPFKERTYSSLFNGEEEWEII